MEELGALCTPLSRLLSPLPCQGMAPQHRELSCAWHQGLERDPWEATVRLGLGRRGEICWAAVGREEDTEGGTAPTKLQRRASSFTVLPTVSSESPGIRTSYSIRRAECKRRTQILVADQ